MTDLAVFAGTASPAQDAASNLGTPLSKTVGTSGRPGKRLAAAQDPAQLLALLPLTMPRLIQPAGVFWNRNKVTPGAQLTVECLQEAAESLRAKYAEIGKG